MRKAAFAVNAIEIAHLSVWGQQVNAQGFSQAPAPNRTKDNLIKEES